MKYASYKNQHALEAGIWMQKYKLISKNYDYQAMKRIKDRVREVSGKYKNNFALVCFFHLVHP